MSKINVFIMTAFMCSIIACVENSPAPGGDSSECAVDAECEENCSARAAEDGSELQSFICRPDLCACGIKTGDVCYALGSTIGKTEVDCPADEDVVAAEVDAKNGDEQ